MSNDTRTMLVVLVVCGFLMCGCIVLPIGVGAMYFLTASRQAEAEMAQAEAQRAVAAAQQARAQAEAARAQAQTMAPIAVPELPPIPAPPGIIPPTTLPSGLAAPDLGNLEQRKQLYAAFKELRKADEELKKAASDDPTVALITSALSQQKDALLKGAGLTPEQIDQILAEGDKAGW